LVAAEPDQVVELLGRFDSLGDDRAAEAVPEVDDRLDDGGIGGDDPETVNEGSIDLQSVPGRTTEVADRRVAGAEVVHRQAHAGVA